MSNMRIALCIAFLVSSAFAASVRLNSLSDEFIEQINGQQNSWKAGRNFDANTPIHKIKKLLGAIERDPKLLGYKPTIHSEDIPIPDTFDARTNWETCSKVISTVVDQSACGSCWATATASAMSDRRCIASNGELTVPVSADDLISCCLECGFGCEGGYPDEAWNHWIYRGIVTGGLYNSSEGCKPYPFENCDHHVEGRFIPCSDLDFGTPKCRRTCNSEKLVYKTERTFGESNARWLGSEKNIQREVLQHGPVSATLRVYEDFLNYKSGVYQYTSGDLAGSHAVRLLGWGVENDTPYWLIANSWNEDWGDKGLFKIRRGVNEAGIEDSIWGASPKI